MHWFRTRAKGESQSNRYASASEIEATFAQQKESVYWTALLITGDSKLATESVVNASGLAQTNSFVFRDWLTRWAHTATARAAIQAVRDSMRIAAEKYATRACSHSHHDPLSQEEITFLQKREPQEIIRALDPLARTVLVLRGCQKASMADCTLLLNVSLRCVLGAYCCALQYQQGVVHGCSGSSERQPTKGSFEPAIQPK